jgi:hypothetical protein
MLFIYNPLPSLKPYPSLSSCIQTRHSGNRDRGDLAISGVLSQRGKAHPLCKGTMTPYLLLLSRSGHTVLDITRANPYPYSTRSRTLLVHEDHNANKVKARIEKLQPTYLTCYNHTSWRTLFLSPYLSLIDDVTSGSRGRLNMQNYEDLA